MNKWRENQIIKQMQIEKENQSNLPWVEKYRPSTLNQLISHQHILSTLRKFAGDNTLPNLLFYGPPGTGKTSTIVALAKQLYKDQYSKFVLELNASDERGIDVVREQIKVFAGSMALTSTQNKSLKLVILDEADMMTPAAQFALRRIIEKSWRTVRFCLISNFVSKVIPALQSRCTRFKFKQLPFEAVKPRIEEICLKEGVGVTQDAIAAIFQLCEGDMRRVVNMLQSLSISIAIERKMITSKEVYEFTGNPPPQLLRGILKILEQLSPADALEKISQVQQSYGISLQSLIKYVYQQLLQTDTVQYTKAFLLARLGDLQYRMSKGCDQKIQLASLVGVFTQSRFVSRT